MYNPFPNPLRIDQVLHGYEDGHRLLSASLNLESSDQRALLTMSDLSGPRVAEDFTEYLTGYPLPSKRFYAFAKTWYAFEMERPGCVWTHTLLIRSEDLEKLRNASPIREFFRRPSAGSVNAYSMPVQFDFPVRPSPVVGSIPLEEVVIQLYSQHLLPVAVVAESGTQFEDLAIRIWSQQWPRLRMNFAFCTGSLSERAINSKPLDLQFGPKRIIRNFGIRLTQSEKSVSWLMDVVEDFQMDTESAPAPKSPFRDFLWRAGDDLSTRIDFGKLAGIFHGVRSQKLKDTVEAIGICYPNREEARTLKRLILSESGSTIHENEEAILRILVETVDSDAFDPADLAISKRATALNTLNRLQSLDILGVALSNPSNSIREEYINGLTETLTRSDFEYLNQLDPRALTKLVRNHLEVTYSDEFWMTDLGVNEKVEIFRSLRKKKSWAVGAVLEVLLRTGNFQTAAVVAPDLEPEQVGPILDFASGGRADIRTFLRPEWLNYFRENQQAVLEWLNRTESIPLNITIISAQILSPDAFRLNSTDLSRGKFLDAAFRAQSLYEERHEVAAFAFAVAASYSEDRACALTLMSFNTLNRALGQSRLSYRAWQIIEPLLPIYEKDPWDNCERLRRSLLSAFQTNLWPPGCLWDILRKDDELFSDMTRTAQRYKPGLDVFLHIWRMIRVGQLGASKKQSKEIRKLVD